MPPVDRLATCRPASDDPGDEGLPGSKPTCSCTWVRVRVHWPRRPCRFSGSAASDLRPTTRSLLDAAGPRSGSPTPGHPCRPPWSTARGPTTPVPLTRGRPAASPTRAYPFASAKAESERVVFEWRGRPSRARRPRCGRLLRPTVSVSGRVHRVGCRPHRGRGGPPGLGHRFAPASSSTLTTWPRPLDQRPVTRVAGRGPFNVGRGPRLLARRADVPAGPGRIRSDRPSTCPAGLSGSPLPTLRADMGTGGPARRMGATRRQLPGFVANDRLRATGWRLATPAKEAYVEARPPAWTAWRR
jgi:hypothetical protein